MEPDPSFKLTLRPYQKQALNWMYSMEEREEIERARNATLMDPLWDEYLFPAEPGCTITGKKFYYNPYSSELSLEFPTTKVTTQGGILADEMGLGKTIMISSLIMTAKPRQSTTEQVEARKEKQDLDSSDDVNMVLRPKKRSRPNKWLHQCDPKATLVIAPVTLLGQWKDELLRASEDSLKVYVYHGESTTGKLDNDVDVVVTSLGTVSSEFNSGQGSIFNVNWYRVVIDEAHNIRNRTTLGARSCYALKSLKRWCLTGTPIINRLDDLYSLLHFLRFKPWENFTFFRSFVIIPFEKADPKALEVVQVIMEAVLLRREKNMKDKDGNPIVKLSDRRYNNINLELSHQERIIYNQIFKNAKLIYQDLEKKGISRNITNVLTLLLRLRQAALHPILALEDAASYMKNRYESKSEQNIEELIAQYSSDGDASFAKQVMENLKANADAKNECSICLDIIENPYHLPCMHAACKACILGWIESQSLRGEEARCPICNHGPISENDLFEIVTTSKKEEQSKPEPISTPFTRSLRPQTPPPTSPEKPSESKPTKAEPPRSPSKKVDLVLRRQNFKSSTKLDALCQELDKIRKAESSYHCVIFSQFTTFMDLIQKVLIRDNFQNLRLDGSLSQKQREQVLEEFQTSENCILVISLRAGGVGLNLTRANYVFLCDVWWNEAIEQQAIDRVHRFGQERDVTVTRFIINDSIEERMIQIQKRKTAVIEAGLGGQKLGKEEFELIFNN